MNTLGEAVEEYLKVRRALGFKLEREGKLLADFARHCERDGIESITCDAAVAWATAPTDADRGWWGSRLTTVRGFARWWSAFDPATEVPPGDLFPKRSHRAEPYPYSQSDLTALMEAARRLRSPLRAATYETLIGLLAVTGMRVGEVIGLDRGDVDFDEALLVVRGAKFDKSREVVLHPSTLQALRSYRGIRNRECPRPPSPAFFVSSGGARLIYKNVHFVFHQLVGRVGLQPRSERCRPRIHDLRHRFAVETLLGWYRGGADVEARLPELSTYLGHTNPKDTYWYLRAAPELLALAAERLEAEEALR